MQLVTQTHGWVLTDARLLWTADSGAATEITPPGVAAGSIRGVLFLDAQTGWVASLASQTEDGSTLTISRTTNAGSSWTTATVNASSIASGSVSFSFLNAQQGWLLVRQESSSNFNFGELFRTVDGGATWTQLAAPPGGGELKFVTLTVGYIADGPLNDFLYETRDGGATWQNLSPQPALPVDGVPAYTVPTFVDSLSGILPVTMTSAGTGAAGVYYYRTTDGGLNWTHVHTASITEELEQGVIIPTDILTMTSWRLVYPNGETVVRTEDGGQSSTPLTPSGVVSGVKAIDFSGSHGWALIQGGDCPNEDKSACTETRDVRWTDTSGQTWTVVGS